MRKHARSSEKAPKAILVQLPTYQRRISYLQKAGDDAKLKQVKKDADSMQAKMVLDFSDNLNYCPVYFFYDQDIDKIRNRQFSGVLFNKSMQAVNNPVISANDSNYFIVQFGVVYVQDNGSSEGSMSAGQNVNSDKHRLQVYNSDFRQLKKPLPMGTNNVWARSKKEADAYKYKSPRFDIYYNPYAAYFNAKLHVFYGKYPY